MTTTSRAITLSILMILALFAAPVRAQQALKPEETAKIKADVLEALQKYNDAFNRRDSKFIGEKVFTNPSVAMGPNGVVLKSAEEIDKQYAGSTQRLVEIGWEKSVPARYNICILNPNTALYNGLFNRVRKDGSVIQGTATTYMFIKVKDGWRMSALFGTSLDKTVTCSD